jgi:hypothetical protein
MKLYSLVILLVVGFAQAIQAQGNHEILIVPSENDTLTSDKELVEENRESEIKYVETENDKGNRVSYRYNFVWQYGGESKLAVFLPKFNAFRVHDLKFLNPYYGLEAGIHPLLVSAAFTFSGVCGVEKGIFNLETSLSHFRTTKINDGNGGLKGPYSQNSFNLKLGIRIKKIYLKIGRSFLLNENVPVGQDRIPLFGIGEINGKVYGVEVQYVFE